jgi:hypothetical protein
MISQIGEKGKPFPLLLLIWVICGFLILRSCFFLRSISRKGNRMGRMKRI